MSRCSIARLALPTPRWFSGHFALETHSAEIAAAMREFFGKVIV
jgi:hypothetical protein